LVYADTVERTLDFFSVSQVLFKTSNTSPVPGLYRIVIEADLFGDQVPFNDTLSRWFEVVDGRDLVLMNIVEPDSDTGIVVNAAAVLPSVRIRNNGLVDADSVEILFHVYNESGQLSYADTIRNLHIGLNDTMLVDANRLLEFNTPGDYELYVINAWWDEDLRSLNDSLSYSYTVRYSRDLALLQHLNPISGLEIPINTGLIPRIRIENKGYDTLFNIEVECRILDASSMEVYRDTVYFSFLEFLGKADLNTKLISFTETGLYTMKTRFLGSNDWLANDSLETMFSVIKDYDVSVDSSDFLETSEPFEVNTSYKPTVWVSSLGDKAFAQPVTVYCKVIVDGFDIYFKSQLVDLDSGESLKVEFDSSLTHDAAGPAEIIFFVNEFEDRLRANDTLRLSFMFEDHSSLAYPLGWGLIVYPNPSGGNYHISSSVPVIRYVITDELGKQIGSHNCQNEREIDLNNELPSGVYYLHVYTDFAVQIVKLISL
jgi:hypothetical protein